MFHTLENTNALSEVLLFKKFEEEDTRPEILLLLRLNRMISEEMIRNLSAAIVISSMEEFHEADLRLLWIVPQSHPSLVADEFELEITDAEGLQNNASVEIYGWKEENPSLYASFLNVFDGIQA